MYYNSQTVRGWRQYQVASASAGPADTARWHKV